MKFFKKIFSYYNFLIITLLLLAIILSSSLIKYHYDGGKNYKNLRNLTLFLAELPIWIKEILKNKTFNLNKPPKLFKHKDKIKFQNFIKNNRNAILVVPRYDQKLSRSVVDLIDLNNFKLIHRYSHDIDKMHQQVQNTVIFPRINIDDAPIRYRYYHPLILKDGSLISGSDRSPLFKIDFCSNLEWVNDEVVFHHSRMLDHDKNIWSPIELIPQSDLVKNYKINDYKDDAIAKINSDGKILYKKSVTEILIENNIFPKNFAFSSAKSNQIDPIHLNDIEPALYDTKFWKKGDVFLSVRKQSAIIHYRPKTNELINYITGPFAWQHDVDIISNKEISIFNNNDFYENNEYSEVVIYDFEKKNFRKIHNNQLKKNNFKTDSNGLSQILNDGSLMVEETVHGRILFFDKDGNKEWEFINKDENGDIGRVTWSRIIEDEDMIKSLKNLINNTKCSIK